MGISIMGIAIVALRTACSTRRSGSEPWTENGDCEKINNRRPQDLLMVCEFLTTQDKRKLMKMASLKELVKAGYKNEISAYSARNLGIISDEKCEKLIQILGHRAVPIIEQALQEFTKQVNDFKQKFGQTP
jgi:hypothetical protein